MKSGEIYTVKTEKMVYGGQALAKIDSMPIFIYDAVPEDILKVKITKECKNYLEADIVEIVQPSQYRVKPPCALYKVCGSCNWLQISYEEQLKQKKLIIGETLKKIAGVDIEIDGIIPSPKISEYRCKIQMPCSSTKVSKRVLCGYYKKNSHELVNIKYCPMQPDIINNINELLKDTAQSFSLNGYDEQKHTGLLRHVIYRISSDFSQILVILVVNAQTSNPALIKLAEILRNKYPQILGVCLNFNSNKTNVITGKKTIIISGQDYYHEQLGKYRYKISSSSFFQVNPYCAKLIFDEVKSIITSRVAKPSILDAYSGVSSFGVYLSDIASSVYCVEEVKSATDDALINIDTNNIENIKVKNSDAAQEFEQLVQKGVSFDVSVTDPPRKGCSIESLEYLSKLTSKYIIYVSCNPSTLARDIKLLANMGFSLEYLKGADMFPNTYHIETIAVLKRTNL